MKLYKNMRTGEYAFTNKAYQTKSSGNTWLIDGDDSYEQHEEIPFNTLTCDEQWSIFTDWCKQEQRVPSHATSVRRFNMLLET